MNLIKPVQNSLSEAVLTPGNDLAQLMEENDLLQEDHPLNKTIAKIASVIFLVGTCGLVPAMSAIELLGRIVINRTQKSFFSYNKQVNKRNHPKQTTPQLPRRLEPPTGNNHALSTIPSRSKKPVLPRSPAAAEEAGPSDGSNLDPRDQEPKLHYPGKWDREVLTACRTAEDLGVTVLYGSGFPFVDDAKKDAAREKTVNEVKKMIPKGNGNVFSQFYALFKPFKEYIKFFKATGLEFSGNITPAFFNLGEVLVTPALMDFIGYKQLTDAEKANDKPFLVYSAVAPNAKKYDLMDNGFSLYLQDMKIAIKQLLSVQIQNGSKKIIWNPWGMGDFLRSDKDSYLKNPQNANVLRNQIAKIFFKEFHDLVSKMSEEQREGFQFYFVTPTGATFDEIFKAEPKANFLAFATQLSNQPILVEKYFTLSPETDMFELARNLSNQYKGPGEVSDVAIINASNGTAIGNRYYIGMKQGKIHAANASEEALTRQSSFFAKLAYSVNKVPIVEQTPLEYAKENRLKLPILAENMQTVFDHLQRE